MSKLSVQLQKLDACKEAVEWSKPYAELPEAWAKCERGDWMLWLAAKEKLCTRQELVLAACACARLSLKYVKKGEKRPIQAIEAAEAWALGQATRKQVCVAYAASVSASASASSASAAAYAAFAADADASAAAKKSTVAACADIVRHHAAKGSWKLS